MDIITIIGVLCLATFGVTWPQLEYHFSPFLTKPHRSKRSCHGAGSSLGSGTIHGTAGTETGRVSLGIKHTPINNQVHRLDTNIFASDSLGFKGPRTIGGEANLLHKPSQSTLGVSAIHTIGAGTDLSASGKYNINQDRSIYGQATLSDPGRVVIGMKDTPINNGDHRLDTHVFASDNIGLNGPRTIGGEANYQHKPSQSTLGVSAVNTQGLGTDLTASGKFNIHQDKNSNVNVEGFASKHIGGAQGSQPVDYGVKLNVEAKF